MDLIERLRSISMEFPQAIEKQTWGHPTFRVKDKIFVGCGYDDQGRATASMKSSEQAALLEIGDPFFMPAYVGSKGWIGIYLDKVLDWGEIEELVEDSYRLIAPKSLLKEL
jgi:predicted DNA-binding protein (MmcQ/YjbR family)